MKTTLIALLALGLCLPLAGAEKDKPAPKQTLCPLMVDTEIDEEEFIIYRGVKVFMCCGSCKKIWRQNPDYFALVGTKQASQLKAVASKTIKPMRQLFCPVYTDTRVHPKSPSIEYKGNTIYLSKARAVTRFKANPAKYEKNLK
jgi:YHS domain-containing protein